MGNNVVDETVNTNADIIVGGLRETLSGDYSIHQIEKSQDGIEVESTYFKLASPMGDVKQKRITNPDLIALTNTMLGLDAVGTHATRLKAVTIHKISQLGDTLSNEGFKDVKAYAKHMFNISETTCNQYLQIARLFLQENGNMIDGLPNLSTSQCIPLLAIANDKGVDVVKSMFTRGGSDDTALLYPSMGASRISQRLREYDKGILDIHGTVITAIEDTKKLKEEIKEEKAKEKEARDKERESKSTKKQKVVAEVSADTSLSPIEQVQATMLHTAQTIRDFATAYATNITTDLMELCEKLSRQLDETAKLIPSQMTDDARETETE